MAERRMFAKTIIDSDTFLDMPLTTQALYFHLSMRADDEGFIGNPKKIVGMLGATKSDFRILIKRDFIILFNSGVVAIKHWKTHNYISPSKLKPTAYSAEKQLLLNATESRQDDGEKSAKSRQNSDEKSAQVSIDKESEEENSLAQDSKGEDSIVEGKIDLLVRYLKQRDDIARVYDIGFRTDLCDLVLNILATQCFADRAVLGRSPEEFLDYAQNGFDAQTLAELVNILLERKAIADKRSYLLAVIVEKYMQHA